jgi:glycine/D-amino acid oxidase-like deaminating enzyme
MFHRRGISSWFVLAKNRIVVEVSNGWVCAFPGRARDLRACRVLVTPVPTNNSSKKETTEPGHSTKIEQRRRTDETLAKLCQLHFVALFRSVSRSVRGITMGYLRTVLFCCFFRFQSIMALSATSAAVTRKNIVVIGGGIQGVSVAYQLAKADKTTPTTITILEAIQPASAASGKGGGFMARSWGDGSPTQRLHELSFDMYEQLASEVQCTSYRKLPVISVAPGTGSSKKKASKNNNPELANIMPAWLDETAVGRVSPMGWGDDTAQITPKEFVDCMLSKSKDYLGGTGIQVVKGVCTGIATVPGYESGTEQVTGVQYRVAGNDNDGDGDATAEPSMLPADAVVVAAGPWSCAAEDWFHGAVQLPMEGIKSTSIVWKKPEQSEVDATALFCGEDNRFGTHCKFFACTNVV